MTTVRASWAPGCPVCEHRHRRAIEAGVAMALPLPMLAKRYGVSHASISRHMRDCLARPDRHGWGSRQRRPKAGDDWGVIVQQLDAETAALEAASSE